MADYVYNHPDHTNGVTVEMLRAMEPEQQMEVMRYWFYENFEDPAHQTPYESAEGGYIWISGGPHDAREELSDEFRGAVSEKVIATLTKDLERDCVEWAPRNTYDTDLFAAVSSNFAQRSTLEKAIANIEDLRDTDVGDQTPVLLRLLYANVITALETYLSDTFINEVLKEDELLRRFVKTNPDFQKRSLKYSEVFEAAAGIKEEVKAYLLAVVWHNLPKVQNMYDAVLGVKFGPAFEDVAKAIAIRHDIVHRNGVTKDGEPIELTAKDVNELIAKTTELVDFVEEQMPPVDDPETGQGPVLGV